LEKKKKNEKPEIKLYAKPPLQKKKEEETIAGKHESSHQGVALKNKATPESTVSSKNPQKRYKRRSRGGTGQNLEKKRRWKQ